MGLKNYLGGITDPQVASEFAERNSVTLNIGGIVKRTARDAYNVVVPGFLGGTVGLISRGIGASVRTVANLAFGLPWAASQKASKLVENVGEAPEKLRWKGE